MTDHCNYLVCYACDVHVANLCTSERTTWNIWMGSHPRSCEHAMERMTTLYTCEDLQTWHFSSQGPWRFKWVPGERSVYVFFSDDSKYATCAYHIAPELECTKDNAIAASKDWITKRNDWGKPGWNEHFWRIARGEDSYLTSGGERRMGRPSQAAKTRDNTPRKSQYRNPSEVMLWERAAILASMFDMTEQKAKTRLAIMCGDLPKTGYEQLIKDAFAELCVILTEQPPTPEPVTEANKVMGLFG